MLTPAQQAEQNDIDLTKKQIEESIQKMEKLFKYIGYGIMAIGALVCLTIIFIPIGLILIVVGFFCKKFGIKAALAETTKRASELNVRQARLDEQVSKN